MDVVTIGSIIKETIVYPDKQIGPVIGSPAAYSSLVMAAQGCKVGIVTYYGYDMENMISELGPGSDRFYPICVYHHK